MVRKWNIILSIFSKIPSLLMEQFYEQWEAIRQQTDAIFDSNEVEILELELFGLIDSIEILMSDTNQLEASMDFWVMNNIVSEKCKRNKLFSSRLPV